MKNILSNFVAVRRLIALIQLGAIMIAVVGSAGVFGFLTGNPDASAWIGSTPMAVSTSLCFVVCAAAIWGLAVCTERVDKVVAEVPRIQSELTHFDHEEIIRRLNQIEAKMETLSPALQASSVIDKTN
jgi:F420-0:gamma-glutamyl ligase-like protein